MNGARVQAQASWPTLEAYRGVLAHAKRVVGGSGVERPDTDDCPLVSVVTVARNAEKLLGETIASVAAQTYSNVEYVVVDGASTDGTIDLLRANDATITRWISEPDRGIYDALNKGIALARGRYVKLLNADDLLPPDSVARAIDAFRDLPRDTCIYGDIRLMTSQGTEYGRWGLEGDSRYFPIVLHPSWYVPTQVYEAQGLYRTDFRVSSDYEYNLRLRDAGVRFHHVGGEPLVSFRMGGASSSLIGVREGFVINRTYQGLWPACYAASMQLFKKLRGRLINRVMGERLALRMRKAVHARRTSRGAAS